MQEKICSSCRVCKSLEEFHKNKSTVSGYAYNCKDCAYIKAVRHRKKYPEKFTAQKKKSYYENRKKSNKVSREYHKIDPEKTQEYQREYRKRLYREDIHFRRKIADANTLNQYKQSRIHSFNVNERFGYSQQDFYRHFWDRVKQNEIRNTASINHIIPVAVFFKLEIYDGKIIHHLSNIDAIPLQKNKKLSAHITDQSVEVARGLQLLFPDLQTFLADIIRLKEAQDALLAMDKGAKRGK